MPWRGCNLYTYPTCEGDVSGMLHDPAEALLVLSIVPEERDPPVNLALLTIRDMCFLLSPRSGFGWAFASYVERAF